ncbi:MAG TPA: hypothetical protein VL754_14440 [Verrucomicrobiae bacterium]|nr:hypothetical protein [Verrucomicrobiae bacterium]
MIQNKPIAAEISALMMDIGGRINQSLAGLKGRVSAAEFERYRVACDMVLMDILMEIVNPIQDIHPDLLGKERVAEDNGEIDAEPRPQTAHARGGGVAARSLRKR